MGIDIAKAQDVAQVWRAHTRVLDRALRLPNPRAGFAAILFAELGDSAGYSQFSQLRKLAGLDIQWVQTGQWAGTAWISKAGRPLLRWTLYQAALGACRTPRWRARREALIARRHGDRHAFFKATVELAAKLLRLVWGVWRSGRPYDPARLRGAPPSQGPVEIVQPRSRPPGRIPAGPALYRWNRASAGS